MRVERKEQGSTRHHILTLLRRHGQMTALDLSEALTIGAVGVRQHLALLERDSLVRVVGLRRSVGRPSHLYSLTEQAEAHFPKQYDQLALDVLRFVVEHGGEDAVMQALRMRRENLMRQISPYIEGRPRHEQVVELSLRLNSLGYMSEYEQLDDGTFVLMQHNCPVDCVARLYPQLCAQEIALYEDLLGAQVIREAAISDGGLCCRYHIPA